MPIKSHPPNPIALAPTLAGDSLKSCCQDALLVSVMHDEKANGCSRGKYFWAHRTRSWHQWQRVETYIANYRITAKSVPVSHDCEKGGGGIGHTWDCSMAAPRVATKVVKLAILRRHFLPLLSALTALDSTVSAGRRGGGCRRRGGREQRSDSSGWFRVWDGIGEGRWYGINWRVWSATLLRRFATAICGCKTVKQWTER
jgi:hypothetical protein